LSIDGPWIWQWSVIELVNQAWHDTRATDLSLLSSRVLTDRPEVATADAAHNGNPVGKTEVAEVIRVRVGLHASARPLMRRGAEDETVSRLHDGGPVTVDAAPAAAEAVAHGGGVAVREPDALPGVSQ
jgi:hypothetical protein